MTYSELPIGLALILCDNIIEDIRTRKKSMIGIFSQIYADSFPYTLPALNILVSMTGCVSDFPCTLVCEHVEDRKTVFSVNCGITAKPPGRGGCRCDDEGGHLPHAWPLQPQGRR